MVTVNLVLPRTLGAADARRRVNALYARALRARDPEGARAKGRARKRPVLAPEQRIANNAASRRWARMNPGWHASYRAKNRERINALARERHALDPIKASAKQRNWFCGITSSDYEALLESQQCVCAICKGPETAKGRGGCKRLLSVDHDHTTGRIRGLLCSSCNAGIGHMRDDISRLQSAIGYLERSRQ